MSGAEWGAAGGAAWFTWVGATFAVALSLIVGDALRACLVRRRMTGEERAGTSWLLGATFSACLVLAVGALRLPWSAELLAGAHVLVAGALGAWARRARRSGAATAQAAAVASSSKSADPALSTRTPGTSRADAPHATLTLLRVALALALLLGAAHTLREGTRFADSHAVWALRAKVVAEDGGFDGSYWRAWSDAHDRRAYPPLLSLAGAWVHSLGPRPDAATTKLVNLGFYLALVALAHAALARRLGRRAALGGALLLALSRPVLLGAGWGVADLPLAAFLLAAVGELGRSRGRCLPLVAACLAGAAACKFEGAWIAGVVLVGAFTLRAQGLSASRLLACGVPAAALLGAWLALVQALGVPLEFGPSADAPANLDTVLRRLGLASAAMGRALLAAQWAWLAPLAALACWRRRGAPPDRLLRLGARVLLALLLVDLCVYAFQAGDTRALLATTLERLLLQLFPTAWVLTLVAWGAPTGAPTSAPGSAPPTCVRA